MSDCFQNKNNEIQSHTKKKKMKKIQVIRKFERTKIKKIETRKYTKNIQKILKKFCKNVCFQKFKIWSPKNSKKKYKKIKK